ncbi:conserved domain protein [Actinomyces sp. oral taxon 170 str. F0386]|nr:conserved domain protein [Actinomyces sp. oral taxon 170 str. F0386]
MLPAQQDDSYATTDGDLMRYWDDIARALEDVDPVCPSRASAAALWKTITADGSEKPDPQESPERMAQVLSTVDRAWLVQLGQDPDTSKESLDQAISFCQDIRSAHGYSTLPLRYARVELSAVLGLRDEALEQLREARLFSFGETTDTGAVLATARMHDDYSGVISTTTAAPNRAEADPVETAQGLGAVLIPYLAHKRLVEAEDAFASLSQIQLPDVVALQSFGDRLEYLGLSSQWQRAIALMRHTRVKGVSEASAWRLMNTAVGLALVVREANRSDYGNRALGASLSWKTPWGNLELTAWDTVAHAYDMMTSFARGIAVRFDARNGNNGVSYRIEMRMAAEAAGLASRSYGTVTSAVPADRSRLRNQGALLKEVRELLTLSRGYGMDSVRQRAMSTAEAVSASLSEVVDDSALELVVDLRLAFGRLLAALGANERAEKEHLDTAELSLSQGWTETACAALALASHAAQARGDNAASRQAWQQCLDAMASWPMNRPGERCGILADAVGDPLIAVQVLSALAEVLVEGVEDDSSRAPIVREVISRASTQVSRCVRPPRRAAEALARVEERIAPYGRGRGGRRRPGSTAAAKAGEGDVP